MTESKPIGERMASAEMWIAEHEKVCGERYKLLLKVITAGISVLVAVAGFGVGALYKNINDNAAALQRSIDALERPQ